jgi:hypothetical protein
MWCKTDFNDLSGTVYNLSGDVYQINDTLVTLSGDVYQINNTVNDLSGRLENLNVTVSGVSQDDFDDLSGIYYGRQQDNNNVIYGNNTGSNGNFNTYIGVNSGGYAFGNSNVAIGHSSGISISGDGNVSLGFRSLMTTDLSLNPQTNVSNSVFIGKYSGYGSSLLRTNDVFQLQNDSNAYLMTGDFTNSNIAIGLNRLPSSSYKLEIGGDISANSIFLGQNIRAGHLFLSNNASISGNVIANEFLSESDKNLKMNIRTMDDGIMLVNKLRPVYYNWRDSEKGTQEEIGFIAQEVEKVVPSLVKEHQGIKHVAYSKIVSILTSSMKEQQDIINEQTKKIKDQERAIYLLSTRIKSIEEFLFRHL